MRKLGLILVSCGLLGLACGRTASEPSSPGQAMELRMEQVQVRSWLKGAALYSFQAAQLLLDEDGGELRAQGVDGRVEPAAFAEARP